MDWISYFPNTLFRGYYILLSQKKNEQLSFINTKCIYILLRLYHKSVLNIIEE